MESRNRLYRNHCSLYKPASSLVPNRKHRYTLPFLVQYWSSARDTDAYRCEISYPRTTPAASTGTTGGTPTSGTREIFGRGSSSVSCTTTGIGTGKRTRSYGRSGPRDMMKVTRTSTRHLQILVASKPAAASTAAWRVMVAGIRTHLIDFADWHAD